MKLDRFYLIVDDVAWLPRVLPCGVRTIQLRLKDVPLHTVHEHARLAKALCAQASALLILNDYAEIALELGIDAVHLGQEDLETANLPALRRAGMRIGVSTHTPEELERALAVNADYIALGPIYPTILKAMKHPPQGLARLTEWKQKISVPLVAIGGFTLDRAAGAFAHGADSVCVVTDVLRHPHPEERIQEWLKV
jgi:thiamine-phosphate pyrophosphorylase